MGLQDDWASRLLLAREALSHYSVRGDDALMTADSIRKLVLRTIAEIIPPEGMPGTALIRRSRHANNYYWGEVAAPDDSSGGSSGAGSGLEDAPNDGKEYLRKSAAWAVPVGTVGPEGPMGPTGPAGTDGADGATGPTGSQGDPGADGAQGIQGNAGADGEGVPTGGTTAQLLAKASATNYDTEWVDAPSGGGYTPVLFMARKTDGAVLVACTGTDPPLPNSTATWDEIDLEQTGFSYSAGEVTIGSALNGKPVEVSVQVNGDGFTNRTQIVIQVERDIGSGYGVGANTVVRSSNYNSRDGDQNEGATSLSGYYIPSVATGDKIRVRVGNNYDTAVGVYGTNGCFWSMKTLA